MDKKQNEKDNQHCGNALLPDALLFPRKKVIADFWDSPFEVGQIITFTHKRSLFMPPIEELKSGVFNEYWHTDFIPTKDGGSVMYCIKSFEGYPQFKDMEWWEERKVEEIMDIKFVKIPHYPNGENDYTIEPVDGTFKKHDFTTFGYYGLMYRKGAGLIASMFTPATEQEYNDFIEGLKK